MKVGILGAGAYGTALGKVLKKNHHATYFYDPKKFKDRGLRDVLEFAEVILLTVPAEAVSKLVRKFPEEAFRKPLVVATKGVMSIDIYEKFDRFEILSGPGFASEIIDGKKIKLTVGAAYAPEMETISEKLFAGDQIRLDRTSDVTGVMLLGGLKNIYAIEAGRRKLENGSDEFKEYMQIALKEAQKFLLYNGGFLETVRLSAGVGDFVLTCGSEESRNYQFGRKLRSFERGRNFRKPLVPDTTTEGLFAAKEIEKLGLFIPRELEILPDILRRIKNATKR